MYETALFALAHFQEGRSRTDIAKFLKVSRTRVNKWITQYHQNGLVDKKTAGRPLRLSEAQSLQLIEYINEHTKNDKGGRLVGTDIQLFIAESFGHQYYLSSVYKLLHRLGFSWITSRSKLPKQPLEVQKRF